MQYSLGMEDSRDIIGDPDKLLESFREHLTDTGGIREQSVSELISLMSETNGKLVPKCISLCIIAASDYDVQSQICGTHAWDILLKWLQEADKEENYSFLVELMRVYLVLPVNLVQLTKNVCPKLIKSLSKRSENEVVRSLAADIVTKWKEVVNRRGRRDGNVQPEIPLKKKRVESRNEESPETEHSGTIRKRRSTVKMPPTVMRTAGIEDATEQVTPKSRSEVLAKKGNQDLSEKALPPQSALPIESFHQKITVTPTEPKKSQHEIQESADFINALAKPQPTVRKKRKIQKAESQLPIFESILESANVKSNMPEPMVVESGEVPDKQDLEGPKKSSLTTFTSFPIDRKPKKKVTWAPEDKLQDISYFEVEDNERVNVARVSLTEIRQKEKSLERQLFKRHEEVEIKDAKWYTPVPLDFTPAVELGCKSVERQIQLERERYVLQAIYFTHESIPVSPEEPEKEEFEAKLAVEIPLEDLHNQDLLIVKDQGDGNSQMSLNPEVADLVKSLALNIDSVTGSSNQPPTLTAPPAFMATDNGIPPIQFNPKSIDSGSTDLNTSPNNQNFHDVDHNECMPYPMDMAPPRLPGPPYMPGECGPPPLGHVNGMRPPRGPLRPRMGGPYHPRFPPSDMPQPHFVRGPMSHPPFRSPPPPMYGPGRPPMNGPPRGMGGRRGGRPEQVCKFFQHGNCRNGSNCHFLHPAYQPPNWG